jgi:hypothetical protein
MGCLTMMKRNLWLQAVLLLLVLSSCGGYDYNDFVGKIMESAKDKIVDQAEYQAMLEMAENSDDDRFDKLRVKGGDIDGSRLRDEIYNYAQKKKLGLERANIWDPNAAPNLQSFNINVFMENSGSMNGYLNDPSTEFKNTVYSLLTRLKLLAGQDSLNLYFVNKKEQPQFVDATNEDLESFKNKLNPSSFRAISVGNTGESDLYAFVKKCLERSNANNLSVLISDCIYSPGPKYPDATRKLGEMRQGLFLQFSDAMQQRDISALVLQFYGNFQGTYYNQLNEALKVSTPVRRPYYVWFIGTSAQIETLLKSKRLMELDGNIENKALFQNLKSPNLPDYKIISIPLHGSFVSDEISKKVIVDAEVSREEKDKGKFGFALAVDFSGGLQDLDYYDDPDNYKCSDGSYKIVVERNKDNNKKSLQNKTHILKLTTDKLTEQFLTIDVIARLPAWVEASNSVNDIDFLNDPSQELKTFGLSAFMNGFGDAFYRKSQTNSIQTLTVTIKK